MTLKVIPAVRRCPILKRKQKRKTKPSWQWSPLSGGELRATGSASTPPQHTHIPPLHSVYTANMKELTLITTRVIIIITCVTVSHLKAEREISHKISVSVTVHGGLAGSCSFLCCNALLKLNATSINTSGY